MSLGLRTEAVDAAPPLPLPLSASESLSQTEYVRVIYGYILFK
jgi:hypothetical protein